MSQRLTKVLRTSYSLHLLSKYGRQERFPSYPIGQATIAKL